MSKIRFWNQNKFHIGLELGHRTTCIWYILAGYNSLHLQKKKDPNPSFGYSTQPPRVSQLKPKLHSGEENTIYPVDPGPLSINSKRGLIPRYFRVGSFWLAGNQRFLDIPTYPQTIRLDVFRYHSCKVWAHPLAIKLDLDWANVWTNLHELHIFCYYTSWKILFCP